MKFCELKREKLTVTYNGVTYSKELFKTAITVTGVEDEAYPTWDSTTVFADGALCIVPELKSIYKSTADSNSGNFPLASLNSKWVFKGYINSANMFACDENIGGVTTGTNIVITIDFKQVTALALLDIDFVGNAIIEQIDNSTSEIIKSFPVSGRDIACSNFAQYCFDPIRRKRKIILTNFKWLPNSSLTITFTGAVSIGTLAFGRLEDMGVTLYGTKLDWESKSLIKVNEFTSYREVQRYGKVRVLEAKVIFDTKDFNYYAQRIDEILDKYILFVPTSQDRFTELIQIGYMERFSIPIDNPKIIETTTTIIGVPK